MLPQYFSDRMSARKSAPKSPTSYPLGEQAAKIPALFRRIEDTAQKANVSGLDFDILHDDFFVFHSHGVGRKFFRVHGTLDCLVDDEVFEGAAVLSRSCCVDSTFAAMFFRRVICLLLGDVVFAGRLAFFLLFELLLESLNLLSQGLLSRDQPLDQIEQLLDRLLDHRLQHSHASQLLLNPRQNGLYFQTVHAQSYAKDKPMVC